MTSQEIFDKVVAHLRAQGKKAVSLDGECAYRASDGCKCAIGCLISDEEYDSTMEGMRLGSFANFPDKRKTFFDKIEVHQYLLYSLQRVHDSLSVEDWEDGLKTVARNHRLIYTPPATPPSDE